MAQVVVADVTKNRLAVTSHSPVRLPAGCCGRLVLPGRTGRRAVGCYADGVEQRLRCHTGGSLGVGCRSVAAAALPAIVLVVVRYQPA